MKHFNTSEMNSAVVNGSVCGPVEATAHPFFMVIYGLLFLVSLVLNSFTVRVYFCRAVHHQSSVTVYLKNLAASDFFLSLCLPLRIANYASGSTLMRHIYCTFGATAFYLNMYASIIFMEYIAVNRYLKIMRPLETSSLQTVKASQLISITTWFVLLVMMCVYIVLSVVSSWGSVPAPGVMGCNALHSPQVHLLNKIFHSLLAGVFVFVLISLVLLYRGTTCRLRQAEQTHRGSCKKLSKAKRNMLVLVSVFCVCFVPYHLVRVPYAFLKHRCAWDRTFYYLKEITVLLSVLNACLDPLIYFIFCQAFRAQLGKRRASSCSQSVSCPDTVSLSQMSSRRRASGHADGVAPGQPVERRASEGLLAIPSTEKRTPNAMLRRTSVI